MTLLFGLTAVIAISGIGRMLLRTFRIPTLPLHWYLALTLLTGMAATSFVVQCIVMAAPSQRELQTAGEALLVVGIVGHFVARAKWIRLTVPRAGWVLWAILGSAVGFSLLAALAPSSKIDELYYHMLFSRRIVEDHGIRVYQLPMPQAIIPQMGYQTTLSVLHAAGAPDAGNVLSLAFGAALLLLIYGVVANETQDERMALFATVACAVGLYPTVWHVTGAPHALGDLGTATVLAALLFPGSLKTQTNGPVLTLICGIASAVAASTKISIMPLAALLAGLATLAQESSLTLFKRLSIVAGIWLLVLGPLIWWSYRHTASPFGVASATLFRSKAYLPETIAEVDAAKRGSQAGLGPAMRYAVMSLNGAFCVLVGVGVWRSIREWRTLGWLLGLTILQLTIIATSLPHEFRFLGGLQYGWVMVGAASLTTRIASMPAMWVEAAFMILVAPWLAAQAYYIAPFAAVDFGITNPQSFLERYVAFTQDFHNLDGILPQGSQLYIENTRLPAIYSPRPAIFSISDWDHHSQVYRFTVTSADIALPDLELQPGADTPLFCHEEVYRDSNAVTTTFRTPGHEPERATLIVQRCR